jgi:hypothetical protein
VVLASVLAISYLIVGAVGARADVE